MIDQQSREYFERRAQQERTAERQAASEPAAKRHRQLAEEYRRLAISPGSGRQTSAEVLDDGFPFKDFRVIS